MAKIENAGMSENESNSLEKKTSCNIKHRFKTNETAVLVLKGKLVL